MKKPLIFIAGLCVIENSTMTLEVAQELKRITSNYNVDFVFKASYDKANRTSINSYRGIGFDNSMYILDILKDTGIKILTDIHNVEQAKRITNLWFIDIVQLPAFLCRQTDLVIALGKTGKTINIKKGQFIAPNDVKYIIEKIESTGNKKIMITERGTCFGYNNLIVDFRSLLIMKKFGYPIIYDCTHSQQLPSSKGNETGGNRDFVIPMAKAAVAIGVDGIFVECHPNPPKAKSDSATSLYLKDVDKLLKEVTKIREVI